MWYLIVSIPDLCLTPYFSVIMVTAVKIRYVSEFYADNSLMKTGFNVGSVISPCVMMWLVVVFLVCQSSH